MSQRDILFITTGPDDALNARLATQSSPVSDAAQDAFDIEVFTHVYDPDLWLGWLDRAADPILPSGLLASEVAAALPPPTTAPTAEAVNAAWAGARLSSQARMESPGVVVDTMQPLYRAIDSLTPAQQYDVVLAQLTALSQSFRSLNLSPLAITALKRVHERVWGYMDPHSDAYLTGIGGSLIENRVQVFAYTYGKQWRQALAGQYNVRVRPQIGADARQFGPGEVLFGLRSDYNPVVGCRPASSTDNVAAPASCYAPTGEVHQVWWQTNGAMAGGRLFTPLQMRSTASDIENANDDLIQAGYDKAFLDGSHVNGADWNTALFEPVTRPGTPWRLYVVAPLAWYWSIYFQPQPEFGGMSFVDWARSMSPSEFIRLQRREATRSNAEMANAWNTTVEGLIGQGAVSAAAEQASAERRRNGTNAILGTGADAVASAIAEATKSTPYVGLIAGVASQVVKVVAAIVNRGSENDRLSVDVYGRLMPAFVVFNIYGNKASFDAAILRQVPAPPSAPTVTAQEGRAVGTPGATLSVTGAARQGARRPAAVSLTGLRVATTAPVQIQGMPWYGGVTIDGARVDGVWRDAAQTLWEVRATPGNRQVRVTAPDGASRDFAVSVPPSGVLLDMGTGSLTPFAAAPPPPLDAPPASPSPPGTGPLPGDATRPPVDGTWSTSTVTPPFVTSPAQPPETPAPSAMTWGNALLALAAAGATGGVVCAVDLAALPPELAAHPSKANKRRRS